MNELTLDEKDHRGERIVLLARESLLPILGPILVAITVAVCVPIAHARHGIGWALLPLLNDFVAWPATERHLMQAWAALSVVVILLCLIPLLGRQRIAITSERILVQEGFWTRRTDEIENFRIRDIVLSQTLWQRLLGIGHVVVLATSIRNQEIQLLRNVGSPDEVRSAVRSAWRAATPPSNVAQID